VRRAAPESSERPHLPVTAAADQGAAMKGLRQDAYPRALSDLSLTTKEERNR